MKRFTKCWGAALCVLSNNALASDFSALIPPLLGVLAVVTLIAVGVFWIFSLFFSGVTRLFVRWLPVVVLWAPVPVGANEFMIFPAAFLLLDYSNMVSNDFLRVLLAEIATISVLLMVCFYISRKQLRS